MNGARFLSKIVLESGLYDYKHPTIYQLVVVERLLRQLQKFGGAMLVASTGLGKTIIATHTAYRLKISRQIENVIVFSPKSVKTNWEDALYSAGEPPRVCWRLQKLRTWSHEQKNKVFPRSPRTSCSYGT